MQNNQLSSADVVSPSDENLLLADTGTVETFSVQASNPSNAKSASTHSATAEKITIGAVKNNTVQPSVSKAKSASTNSAPAKTTRRKSKKGSAVIVISDENMNKLTVEEVAKEIKKEKLEQFLKAKEKLLPTTNLIEKNNKQKVVPRKPLAKLNSNNVPVSPNNNEKNVMSLPLHTYMQNLSMLNNPVKVRQNKTVNSVPLNGPTGQTLKNMHLNLISHEEPNFVVNLVPLGQNKTLNSVPINGPTCQNLKNMHLNLISHEEPNLVINSVPLNSSTGQNLINVTPNLVNQEKSNLVINSVPLNGPSDHNLINVIPNLVHQEEPNLVIINNTLMMQLSNGKYQPVYLA